MIYGRFQNVHLGDEPLADVAFARMPALGERF